MNSRELALRRYYWTIRSYLPCSGKLKKQILMEIRANISHYLEEFPEAEFPQIEARFGTPQSIAAAYVDDLNTQELLVSLHIRRKILTIVLAGISIAALLWASAILVASHDHYRDMNGYGESYIVDSSAESTN